MYNTTQQRKSWGAGNFPFNWAALYCAHFEGEKLYDLQSYSWQTTDKPCQAWSHSCLCSYFLQVTCLVGVSIPMSDPAAGRAEQRSQGNVTLWSMFLTDRNMPSFQHLFLRGWKSKLWVVMYMRMRWSRLIKLSHFCSFWNLPQCSSTSGNGTGNFRSGTCGQVRAVKQGQDITVGGEGQT